MDNASSASANLRQKIASLASQFAEEVLGLISTSIAEHLRTSAPTGRISVERAAGARGGRGGRRSISQLNEVGDRILSELDAQKDGIRAEELRARLRLPRNAIARPLAMLLTSRRIRKTGQKRQTTYFASGGKGGKVQNGKAAKKGRAEKSEGQAAAAGT